MARNGIVIIAMEYPPFLRGGLGTHVAILTRELAGRGIPVYVFAYSPEPLPPRQEKGITIVTVSTDKGDYSKYSRHTLEDFYAVINARLYEAADSFFLSTKHRPAAIHCHDFHGYPAASKLRNLLQVPLVCTIHLLHEPLMRWGGEEPPKTHIEMERMMCLGSDQLITVCSGFRDLVMEKYADLAAPIHVIHNGIETDIWASTDDTPANRIKETFGVFSDTVIVFAGRFTAQKSIVQMIDSAFTILSARNDITYLFAGYFENAAYARAVRIALQRYPGISKRLRFLGKLPRDQIRQLYKIADIALVPSLYEGVPYSALEAMAARLPVIASDTCGITDLIQHRRSGLLVPLLKHVPDSGRESSAYRAVEVPSLTAAQRELLDNHDLALSMAEQGQARVLEVFTISNMVDQTVRVYKRA